MNAKTQRMVRIAMNKSLLKEYNMNGKRTVYLNDGDEFQLQLFNPHSFRIAAAIEFNNKLQSSRKLILNPGERVWLERYLDENKKLCFKTYWVDKGSSVVDSAIASNGQIGVSFYKEQENFSYSHITYEPHIYYNNAFDLDTPLTTRPPYNYTTGDYRKSNVTSEIVADLGAYYCQTISEPEATKASIIDNGTNANATATAASTSYWATTTSNPKSYRDTLKIGTNSCINEPKKETGRVERGNYSSQHFNETSLNLELFPFQWETIYILPESEKPVTNKDLQKKYCPNCGRKLKDKFRFCPFCGERV